MILLRIMGGLGNQMFQYAAGKALAERLHQSLYLDLSWFQNPGASTPRDFSLSHFKAITDKIATPEEIRFFFPETIWKRIQRRLFIHSILKPKMVFLDETKHSYINRMPKLNKSMNIHMTGYWQSEFYFRDSSTTIRSLFSLEPPTDSKNRELFEKLNSGNHYISLHIRRGDYITNPVAAARLGNICSKEYYQSAINRLLDQIPNAHFIIFSDEPDWVVKNFPLPLHFTVVDWNSQENSYRDLQLMSQCSHHILANSSFSWWGAWLGRNKNKTVIAPARWWQIKNPLRDQFIVPENWIRL